MNRSHFLTLFAGFVLTTSACASHHSGPTFHRPSETPSNKGVVHFFRPSKMSGKNATIFLAVGNDVVNLESATYYSATLNPGRYEAVAVIYGKQTTVLVEVSAGADAYVRMEAVSQGLGLAPRGNTVTPDAALPEIGACRLAASKPATSR